MCKWQNVASAALLTHDKSTRHLDTGVGQTTVPFLPENVLRFCAHIFAV